MPNRWPVLVLTFAAAPEPERWELFTSLALSEHGCLGVEEPPARDGRHDVRLFLPQPAEGDAPAVEPILATLAQWVSEPLLSQRVEWFENEDWATAWKRHFRRTRVSEHLLVGPPWETEEDDAVGPGDHRILIEPGQAFGTGTHATTRLCLRMLEAHPPRDGVVLDVGAGSGVLSLAALKLGAREALCLEMDPVCEENLLLNAALNGLSGRLHFILGAHPRVALGEALLRGVAAPDLILCNMLSSEFTPVLPELWAIHRPVILSGFLMAEEAAVRDSVLAQGWKIADSRTLEEWQSFYLTM